VAGWYDSGVFWQQRLGQGLLLHAEAATVAAVHLIDVNAGQVIFCLQDQTSSKKRLLNQAYSLSPFTQSDATIEQAMENLNAAVTADAFRFRIQVRRHCSSCTQISTQRYVEPVNLSPTQRPAADARRQMVAASLTCSSRSSSRLEAAAQSMAPRGIWRGAEGPCDVSEFDKQMVIQDECASASNGEVAIQVSCR
jgi:hypothetical protein